jgi:outer membrane protein assembly factor BamE (lipoprotein component of BamABCDE complex)
LLKSKVLLLSSVCALLIFTGCEKIQGPEVPESRLTAGKVQQNVSKGMFSTDVVKALGSPNIITKDKTGKTTWVYDRVSTYHSKTNGGLNFVRMNANDFVITGGIVAGTAAALSNSNPTNFLISAAAIGLATLINVQGDYEYKTEQKTMTIILDFDENDKLSNFSYMYSSF